MATKTSNFFYRVAVESVVSKRLVYVVRHTHLINIALGLSVTLAPILDLNSKNAATNRKSL